MRPAACPYLILRETVEACQPDREDRWLIRLRIRRSVSLVGQHDIAQHTGIAAFREADREQVAAGDVHAHIDRQAAARDCRRGVDAHVVRVDLEPLIVVRVFVIAANEPHAVELIVITAQVIDDLGIGRFARERMPIALPVLASMS